MIKPSRGELILKISEICNLSFLDRQYFTKEDLQGILLYMQGLLQLIEQFKLQRGAHNETDD